MYFHIFRPALNLHLVSDKKNWMSAASIHISWRDAAHVHLHAARREKVRNGEWRGVVLDGRKTSTSLEKNISHKRTIYTERMLNYVLV